MFNFDLKSAAIYRTIKLDRSPIFRYSQFLKGLFLILFVIFFLLFLVAFLSNSLEKTALARLAGISLLILVATIFFYLASSFFKNRLTCPSLETELAIVAQNPEHFNLAEYLSFPVAKAANFAVRFTKEHKIMEVDSVPLFYYLLRDNPKLKFIFVRTGLSFDRIKKRLKENLEEVASQTKKRMAVTENEYQAVFRDSFQNSMLEAMKIAAEKGHRRIEKEDMIAGLAQFDPIFKKGLIQNRLKVKDIENLARWLETLRRRIKEKKKWWGYKNLVKKGSLGREWAAGYTLNLDRYSIDWTRIVRGRGFPETIGHLPEIRAVERILSRSELNNVLLVGEPGTGRKSIVSAVSVKSDLGESLPEVNYKRIVELDLPFLVSRLENKEEIEEVLNNIFQEVVSAGNVVLVINEFHNFVGGEERPGVVDISGVLSSFLYLPQFQIIAVSSYAGLHRYIEKRPTLLSLFAKVEVGEVSAEETLVILENLVPMIEEKYKVFFFYPALREIVSLSEKYLPGIPFPKKAMDVLDEVGVKASSDGKKVVTESEVAEIISEKTQIPIGEIELKEREVLLNLEKLIHQRIINQDLAVKEISSALRRARAEIKEMRKPMGTFLFLGPTGVGKTETAKALADIYFGSEKKIIRMDMSEFQQVKDISRLIGSSGEDGILTTRVREDPFSLVLLDDIEKAHPNILNLFLQVLDEGRLTDGLGRLVDFKSTIIIATSNAGYRIILEAINQKSEWATVKEKLFNHFFEEGTFRPEFLNRFDAAVVFSPLSKENLLDIAGLLLKALKEGLLEKDIELVVTRPLEEKIVELSYNPRFGAREMKRVIQDKVENVLAQAILAGTVRRGDKIEVNSTTFQIHPIK